MRAKLQAVLAQALGKTSARSTTQHASAAVTVHAGRAGVPESICGRMFSYDRRILRRAGQQEMALLCPGRRVPSTWTFRQTQKQRLQYVQRHTHTHTHTHRDTGAQVVVQPQARARADTHAPGDLVRALFGPATVHARLGCAYLCALLCVCVCVYTGKQRQGA